MLPAHNRLSDAPPFRKFYQRASHLCWGNSLQPLSSNRSWAHDDCAGCCGRASILALCWKSLRIQKCGSPVRESAIIVSSQYLAAQRNLPPPGQRVEPIPRYGQYHRPIVHLPSFCSDDSRGPDSIGIVGRRRHGLSSVSVVPAKMMQVSSWPVAPPPAQQEERSIMEHTKSTGISRRQTVEKK